MTMTYAKAALWAVAIALLQIGNGSIETSFTPHLPAISKGFGLEPGQLGTVLAGLPIGLLFGALAGGWLCKRFRSRPILLVGAVGFFGSLPLTVLAPTPSWLMGTLFVAGFLNGAFDTAWNLQSLSYAASRPGRQQHQKMSAMFSLGSIGGVGFATLALYLGVDALWHLSAVAFLMVGIALAMRRFFPKAPERDPQIHEETPDVVPGTVDPSRATFATLCVAAFIAFFPLGAAYSWSTPYLDQLGAAAWLAPAGLIAYTVFEGLGRLLAFWYSDRVSPTLIVRVGALLALAGALLIVLPGRIDLAIAGWALVALGVSPAGPTWQTAASNSAQAGNRQMRVATLTSVSYTASMVGLPIVGWVAQLTSLRVSLGLIALCALLLLVLAPAARAAAKGRPADAELDPGMVDATLESLALRTQSLTEPASTLREGSHGLAALTDAEAAIDEARCAQAQMESCLEGHEANHQLARDLLRRAEQLATEAVRLFPLEEAAGVACEHAMHQVGLSMTVETIEACLGDPCLVTIRVSGPGLASNDAARIAALFIQHHMRNQLEGRSDFTVTIECGRRQTPPADTRQPRRPANESQDQLDPDVDLAALRRDLSEDKGWRQVLAEGISSYAERANHLHEGSHSRVLLKDAEAAIEEATNTQRQIEENLESLQAKRAAVRSRLERASRLITEAERLIALEGAAGVACEHAVGEVGLDVEVEELVACLGDPDSVTIRVSGPGVLSSDGARIAALFIQHHMRSQLEGRSDLTVTIERSWV